MEDYYLLTSGYVIVLDIILAITLVQTLRLFFAPRRLSVIVAISFFVWLGALLIMVPGQRLFPDDISGLSFFIVLLMSITVVVVSVFLSPLKSALLNVPQEFLLFPQGLRMFFGAGFLIEASLGVMPTLFGVLDGITHITAAFLALMAAIMIKSPWASRRCILTANLFGLLDIVVVAVGISFILFKDIGPYRNVMYAAFFAAPLFITLHFVSLYKLMMDKWPRQKFSLQQANR